MVKPVAALGLGIFGLMMASLKWQFSAEKYLQGRWYPPGGDDPGRAVDQSGNDQYSLVSELEWLIVEERQKVTDTFDCLQRNVPFQKAVGSMQ
jgi:hypothetical protein